MGSIFAAMRRCQLFDGIPEEKYQNVLNCLHGEVRAIVVWPVSQDRGRGNPTDPCTPSHSARMLGGSGTGVVRI